MKGSKTDTNLQVNSILSDSQFQTIFKFSFIKWRFGENMMNDVKKLMIGNQIPSINSWINVDLIYGNEYE